MSNHMFLFVRNINYMPSFTEIILRDIRILIYIALEFLIRHIRASFVCNLKPIFVRLLVLTIYSSNSKTLVAMRISVISPSLVRILGLKRALIGVQWCIECE